MSNSFDPVARSVEYSKRHSITLVGALRHGVHGSVFAAESQPENSAALYRWAWLDEKREQFGERWPEVQRILRALEAMGIHYVDVSPKNISLSE